jgi:hypothetical protein
MVIVAAAASLVVCLALGIFIYRRHRVRPLLSRSIHLSVCMVALLLPPHVPLLARTQSPIARALSAQRAVTGPRGTGYPSLSANNTLRVTEVRGTAFSEPVKDNNNETPPDVFISFRFGEAHAEALALKAALEANGHRVFLSDVSPGGDLQTAISHALSRCKLAVILATRTYGARTNGLFDTSNEMNFIIGRRKAYYLVRMIPFEEEWEEPATTMAFPPSIMFKLWLPGTPMADGTVEEIEAKLSEVVLRVDSQRSLRASISSERNVDTSGTGLQQRVGTAVDVTSNTVDHELHEQEGEGVFPEEPPLPEEPDEKI